VNVRRAIATFRGNHIPNVDFIGRKRIWFALSGFIVLLSLVGLFARGLNFSIAFKGGALLEFPDRSRASVADYQRIMARYGLGDAQVEIITGGDCQNGCVNIRSRSLTELGLIAPPPATPAPSPSVSAATPTPSASGSASPSATATSTPSAASPTPTASASAGASPSASPVPSATPAGAGALPTLKGDQLRAALAREAGISVNDINEQDVGPTWGSTISRKALLGLVIFLVLVSLYIAVRFEPKMAAAALVALFHDLIVTAGIYALVGREVTPETVIAVLTILGYSLYDTVVIFDKIKENSESTALLARETYSGMVNLSLNQVFMRSVNTSLATLLPIMALLLFGGQTLKDFAFALFVGIASGTYSSIFVAAPVLAVLKEREPRYQQIRVRAEQRAARPGLRVAGPAKAPTKPVRQAPAVRELTPVPAVTTAEGDGDGAVRATPQAPARPRPSASSSGGGAARSKKKGRPQGKPKKPRRR
jgi:preprotein translocase subunit SecF